MWCRNWSNPLSFNGRFAFGRDKSLAEVLLSRFVQDFDQLRRCGKVQRFRMKKSCRHDQAAIKFYIASLFFSLPPPFTRSLPPPFLLVFPSFSFFTGFNRYIRPLEMSLLIGVTPWIFVKKETLLDDAAASNQMSSHWPMGHVHFNWNPGKINK